MGVVYGNSSQYTRHSRMRRAISWLYWAPKSRTRTVCAGEDTIVIFEVMITKSPHWVKSTRHFTASSGAGNGAARVEPPSARNNIGTGQVKLQGAVREEGERASG